MLGMVVAVTFSTAVVVDPLLKDRRSWKCVRSVIYHHAKCFGYICHLSWRKPPSRWQHYSSSTSHSAYVTVKVAALFSEDILVVVTSLTFSLRTGEDSAQGVSSAMFMVICATS